MKEERSSHRKKNNICSKTEGALFLAMSFFALLSIGILGYLKISELDKSPASILPASNVVPSLSPMQKKIQDKLPVPRGDMVAPIIDVLQGKWVSLFEHGGIVNLSLFDDRYEIVYMQSVNAAVRKYSKGRYSYDGKNGKITLYPMKDVGTPAPVAGVSYKILTMRHYDIYISKLVDDVSLYFIAPESSIAQKNYYPLFSYADYGGAPVLQFSPMQVKQ